MNTARYRVFNKRPTFRPFRPGRQPCRAPQRLRATLTMLTCGRGLSLTAGCATARVHDHRNAAVRAPGALLPLQDTADGAVTDLGIDRGGL